MACLALDPAEHRQGLVLLNLQLARLREQALQGLDDEAAEVLGIERSLGVVGDLGALGVREPGPQLGQPLVVGVARRFPDLKILMAHFSNPWWEEAWKISWSHPNVYADLSGGTAIHRATRMWAECFAPDGELLESSVRKLCFASYVRYFEQGAYPFEPYVAFYERVLERIGAPEALKARVYRGNARALFGLEGC